MFNVENPWGFVQQLLGCGCLTNIATVNVWCMVPSCWLVFAKRCVGNSKCWSQRLTFGCLLISQTRTTNAFISIEYIKSPAQWGKDYLNMSNLYRFFEECIIVFQPSAPEKIESSRILLSITLKFGCSAYDILGYLRYVWKCGIPTN